MSIHELPKSINTNQHIDAITQEHHCYGMHLWHITDDVLQTFKTDLELIYHNGEYKFTIVYRPGPLDKFISLSP